MKEFGVEKIYMDKQSGKDFNRPQYMEMVNVLNEGDVLVLHSIDRLGRNYDEILEQWRVITKEKRAQVVVLDMPLLDTRQGRDLTGTLIADIVLQLLSYVAQKEREFIRKRQAEGIAAKKARGDWDDYGRPRKEIENLAAYREKVAAGEMTVTAVCNELGICRATWYERVKEMNSA
jgi:DNA invertase Pin-like site-specific DNA recombinase